MFVHGNGIESTLTDLSSEDDFDYKASIMNDVTLQPKYNIESQEKVRPTRFNCLRKSLYYGFGCLGVLGIIVAILYLFIGVYQTSEDTKTLSGLSMNLMVQESKLQNQVNALSHEIEEIKVMNEIKVSDVDEKK